MLEALEDRVVPSQMWTVNVATDNGGAGGQGNGLFGDVRYCCSNAQTGDTINFAAGLNGQTINLRSEIPLTTGATINGTGQNITISGQNITRVFEVMAGAVYTIDGLTFTGGNGTDGHGNAGNGGAILVDSGVKSTGGNLRLDGDTFTSNKTTGAGTNGGAIENDYVTSVYGCTFKSNNSIQNGGAIENTHNLLVDALQSAPYTQSMFSKNTAVWYGGAIDSSGKGVSGAQLTVSNSSFDSNSAKSGGAINTNDPTTLTSDTFGAGGANTASGSGGGALFASFGGGNLPSQVSVNSCNFRNNQALGPNGNGGAIYTQTTLDVEQSTFAGNASANRGGAIFSNFVNLILHAARTGSSS